jgi:hypothetical protein
MQISDVQIALRLKRECADLLRRHKKTPCFEEGRGV